MNKTYTAIIVLIVVVGGGLLVYGMGHHPEASMPGKDGMMNNMGEGSMMNDNQSGAQMNQMPMGTDSMNSGTEGGMNTGMDMNATMPPMNANMAAGTVKEFTVTGSNFSFTPNMITVSRGDMVKINFKNANGFHNLIIDEFHVATKTIKTGETDSIEFTADKTGSFQYYCSVGTHRAMGMWGTLKVE